MQQEPLIQLTVTGPYTSGTLQKLADDVLQPRLAAVPGVAGINVSAGTDFGVSVNYDAALLRQIGVSPMSLTPAIRDARSDAEPIVLVLMLAGRSGPPMLG